MFGVTDGLRSAEAGIIPTEDKKIERGHLLVNSKMSQFSTLGGMRQELENHARVIRSDKILASVEIAVGWVLQVST